MDNTERHTQASKVVDAMRTIAAVMNNDSEDCIAIIRNALNVVTPQQAFSFVAVSIFIQQETEQMA